MRTGAGRLAAVTAVGLGAAPAVWGCAVCYGAADSAQTAGLNAAILFLLAVVALVQAGLVALFVSIRRRGRDYERRKAELHLIEGGAR